MKLVLMVVAVAIMPFLACSRSDHAQEDSDPMLLVNIERAFAKQTIELGIPRGFMSFAADDGVVFVPHVAKVKEFYKARENNGALLTWHPEYAEISSAGDLGWTTGPWEYRAKAGDVNSLAYGHYNTIWRLQPDSSWKFVVDFGCSHDAPATPRDSLRIRTIMPAEGAVPANRSQGESDLRAQDEHFSIAAHNEGLQKAYAAFSDADIRFYRNGAPPVRGLEAMLTALKRVQGDWIWQSEGIGVSQSGDLGYVYGISTLTEADRSTRFSYLHIWRKHQSKEWKLALDIHSPLPPEATEEK